MLARDERSCVERAMSSRRCNASSPMIVMAIVTAAIGPLAYANPPLASPVPAAEPLDAIWRIERVELEYRSFNTYYSCAALEAKLTAILRAVGVHENIVVDVRCPGRGFVRDARAYVNLLVPVAATADNVRAATTYDAQTELTARLRNIQLPSANDLPRFAAEWRTISLTRDSNLRLDSADCDLLEAVRDQIFPKLAIRVTRDKLHCTSWSPARLRPTLEVAALMPRHSARSSTEPAE
jgi:hypothetical protein